MNKWESRSPTYRSWESMIQRCTNPNHDAYERYVSKGLTICKDWLTYSKFKEDMGVRPSGLTLDRINNNLGYYKENCRWATPQTQQFNRGKFLNCTSKHKNVYWNKKSSKWMARGLQLNGERVYLGLFIDEMDAVKALENFYDRNTL